MIRSRDRGRWPGRTARLAACCAAWAWTTLGPAAEMAIRSDRPNAVEFPAQEARFVRLSVAATSGNAAAIDELEVYGPDGKQNLALAKTGAKAAASSCIAGHVQHAVEHLNDGRYGNDSSWVAGQGGQCWAQIELPKPVRVGKVVFSRDRNRVYADRTPLEFEVQLSDNGQAWRTIRKVRGELVPVALRRQAEGFAGVVPPPPPPPRRNADGSIAPSATRQDLKVPAKDELGLANLALGPKAKAAASSLLAGYPIHQVPHLNDGLAGNAHSWISAGEPSWAEIDLGGVYWVWKVAFASDDSRQYGDRAATKFSILVATEHHRDGAAPQWKAVYRHSSGAPIETRTPFAFPPVPARWVRIAIDGSNAMEARIDEIEVYGQQGPIPAERIRPALATRSRLAAAAADAEELLRYAILGEEHAWLKTYGRSDLSPRLVPYNGRVQEYPRHVGDDRLPLAPLSQAPRLDGVLDDPCWQEASRGVVRVADTDDFQGGPLVETAVTAGWKGEDLFLVIRADRLLSSHLAVVSRSDGEGCGVLALGEKGLVFNVYDPKSGGAKLKRSTPVDGAVSIDLAACEVRLPLAWFADCPKQGLRVGLGMGGKHTPAAGRPVNFVFAPLAVAQAGPCAARKFQVRLSVPEGGSSVRLRGNALPSGEVLALGPGESRLLAIPAVAGPIGPQFDLKLEDEDGESYSLHLFRYDPLERTLALMDDMVRRLAAKGLDLRPERDELAAMGKRHEALMSAPRPDRAAERQTLLDARLAKRRLVFRDPDLTPLERILFVKRHAYEPSHNYSVMLDSPWRPGGGVYRLDVPRRNGRLEVGEARLTELFDSKSGIARDAMANFDLSKVYFAYRPSFEGYFHVMVVDPDGSGLKQLTSGPFHDYWPCPLPDGGLAMISSRCKARYLCWRPQVSVLFRMDVEGRDIRPLSYANLSEWGPSVTSDGRLIWTRSEYIDKGADFSHTLWTIRPDGTMPELVFGNTIIQPNGYANGREVPGTKEVCCTLISHFGDLNGPIALVDTSRGRFDPKAIRSITPEVPWPGMWPEEECFRDPVPVARDYVLCSHAPRRQFGLYVIDRYGNREVLYQDLGIGSMCPTPYRAVTPPPVLTPLLKPEELADKQPGNVGWVEPEGRSPTMGSGNTTGGSSLRSTHATTQPLGQLILADVYRGLEPAVRRGSIKYLRVVEEVRAGLEQMPDGQYRRDHEPFTHFYAAPVDLVSGPFGWPSYVAKAPWGLAPVEADGSANFLAPAGKTLYLQALDEDLNEVQRMRSVVQLQPGEQRSCIGCHEDRRQAPPTRPGMALRREPSRLEPPPWGTGPLSYEQVVQPVLDARCVQCHTSGDKNKIDLSAKLDVHRVPASYRTLIQQGWVHVLDCGWNSGGNEKRQPHTFGTFQSKLWKVLDVSGGHYGVQLSRDEMHALKCWIDMNCPLWPDYTERRLRPLDVAAVKK